MSCQEFELLLAEEWGGEISADDRVRLDGHLAQCPTCRNELAAGARAVQLLRSLPTAEPDAQAWIPGGDHEKLRGRPTPASGRALRLVFPLMRYAAVIAVAFTAGYASKERTPARLPGSTGIQTDRTTEMEPGVPEANSFESALARAYRRNPAGSDLAKCMSALFRSG